MNVQWIHDCVQRKMLLPTYSYRVLEQSVRQNKRHFLPSLQAYRSMKDQVTMSQLQGKHPPMPTLPDLNRAALLPPPPPKPALSRPAEPLPAVVTRKRPSTVEDLFASLPKAHGRAMHAPNPLLPPPPPAHHKQSGV